MMSQFRNRAGDNAVLFTHYMYYAALEMGNHIGKRDE